jgi:6-phosphogluconolactonase/glucosamine-6-phosphate isomerase/deaminase
MSPRYDVRVSADPAGDAAEWLAAAIGVAVARRSVARIAVSGGSTAPVLFSALSATPIDFERIEVWQVDERVAPDGDAVRNLGQLLTHPWTIHAMPVTDSDLAGAARAYESGLPERFDAVHLGVGSDGHTASWPPGRDVSLGDETGRDVPGRDVVVVRDFHGNDRLTITPPVVARARHRLVLVTGADKAAVVRRWTDGDPGLPATLIPVDATTVFLDPPAAADLDPE